MDFIVKLMQKIVLTYIIECETAFASQHHLKNEQKFIIGFRIDKFMNNRYKLNTFLLQGQD